MQWRPKCRRRLGPDEIDAGTPAFQRHLVRELQPHLSIYSSSVIFQCKYFAPTGLYTKSPSMNTYVLLEDSLSVLRRTCELLDSYVDIALRAHQCITVEAGAGNLSRSLMMHSNPSWIYKDQLEHLKAKLLDTWKTTNLQDLDVAFSLRHLQRRKSARVEFYDVYLDFRVLMIWMLSNTGSQGHSSVSKRTSGPTSLHGRPTSLHLQNGTTLHQFL